MTPELTFFVGGIMGTVFFAALYILVSHFYKAIVFSINAKRLARLEEINNIVEDLLNQGSTFKEKRDIIDVDVDECIVEIIPFHRHKEIK